MDAAPKDGEFRFRWNVLNPALCGLLSLLCGCTYSFTGGGRNDIGTIAIPTFENSTLKYGVEAIFTERTVNAFVADGRLKVVSEKNAESVLLCKITDFSRAAFSYDELGNVRQDKVAVTLDVLYKKSDTEEVIFERKGFVEWALYFLASETEDDAIVSAADKFGQDVIRELVSTW